MKKLVRPTLDRKLAGVCSGIANYFGIDANLVRILWVVGTFISFGTGILAYAICYVLMPSDS